MSDRHDTVVVGSAAIIIEKDDRILLTKRSRAPRKGYWHLPGGGVEFGESLRETVIRELKEELEIDIVPINDRPDLITEDIIPEEGRHVICAHFLSKITGGSIRAADGTEDFHWFTLEEVIRLPHLLDSTRTALRTCLSWMI